MAPEGLVQSGLLDGITANQFRSIANKKCIWKIPELPAPVPGWLLSHLRAHGRHAFGSTGPGQASDAPG